MTADERRAAVERLRALTEAGESIRIASQRVAEQVGVHPRTLQRWAQAQGVALAPSPRSTENARRANREYGRQRREAFRASLQEALEEELAAVRHEQELARKAREEGGRLLYGEITGTSRDGEKLYIRAQPPDHGRLMQQLAVSHAVLQDKDVAERQAEGEPTDPASVPAPDEVLGAGQAALDELAARRQAKGAV